MTQLSNKSDFLEKYQISENEYKESKLEWAELKKIYEDYCKKRDSFKKAGEALVSRLQDKNKVHAIKLRIKDPEHLVEKIIRKKIKDKQRNISLADYQNEITDLIGIRILHLYKSGWEEIDNEIRNECKLKEKKPTVYIREGDSDKVFDKKKLKVQIHPEGYRSVHYVVKETCGKNSFFIEIQVRTLIEEAWSEIDHKIRYPYNLNEPIVGSFLDLFNLLAGLTDGMGSFVQSLQENQIGYLQKLKQNERSIEELKETIKELKTTKEQKQKLNDSINNLKVFGPLGDAKLLGQSLEKMSKRLKEISFIGSPLLLQDLRASCASDELSQAAEQAKKVTNVFSSLQKYTST